MDNKDEVENPLIIRTKSGRVRGLTRSAATGKMVDTWYGIPYAKKPLGKETIYYHYKKIKQSYRK